MELSQEILQQIIEEMYPSGQNWMSNLLDAEEASHPARLQFEDGEEQWNL